MPELPDIEAYLEALRPRMVGERLLGIRLRNPFLLRTVDPAPDVLEGGTVKAVFRLGKRLVLEIVSRSSVQPYFMVIHLMIAGRLQWRPAGPLPEGHDGAASAAALSARARGSRSANAPSPSPARVPAPRGNVLAAFEFSSGTLFLTEAGSKRRASLHLVRGRDALAALDPGGLDVATSTPAQFAEALRRQNRTLKRALTDPKVLSGIGNAYSDEILHRARLSPFRQTGSLTDEEIAGLHCAAVAVLAEWTIELVAEARGKFPEKVTAFRPGMAVHGKFGARCPVCGEQVQRIVYADNECDYCPGCQTGGRVLADRSLSRLLKDDWPRGARGGDDEG
jgi:formamidopyrimidine-DNA glycosylase